MIRKAPLERDTIHSREYKLTRSSTRARIGLLASLVLVAVLSCAAVASGTQPYETYETAVAGSSPVAQFRFDDPTGSTTLEDSIGSHTYTATNTGISLGGGGPFGGSKAGSFGGSAYATLPSDPLSGAKEFSFEGWIYWTGSSSYGEPIFDFGSSSSNHMYLTPSAVSSSHKMLFEIHPSSGSALQVTAPKPKASAWEYLAVTETSSGTITVYANGEVTGEAKGATVSPASLSSSPSDYLGKPLITGEPSFTGSLSNVAFYTKALSQEQVRDHYFSAEFPVNTSPPTIAGTAKEGNTLKAKEGTWIGLPATKVSYVWQRCTGAGVCPTVVGEGSTYVVQSGDVGDTLRVLVKEENEAGKGEATSIQTETVAGVPPKNTELPVITGETKDGKVLTATEGKWSGTPATEYKYQWEHCLTECHAIPGATKASYRATSEEITETLRVTVTDKNPAGNASATSEKSAAISVGPPVNVETEPPTISGEAREGQMLSANAGAWAGTGSGTFSYSYRWEDCSPKCEPTGATGSTYTLVSSDVGHTVQVVVIAKGTDGTGEATSQTTTIVAGNPPKYVESPKIEGEAREGQTLTATTGVWSGTGPFSYEYHWEVCDSLGVSCITEGTGATYHLNATNVGGTLRVAVTAKGAVEPSASATSEATSVVKGNAPKNIGLPAIKGEAVEGRTLEASEGEWEGTPTIKVTSYNWLYCKAGECNPIPGASGPEATTYKLTAAYIGDTIAVEVAVENSIGSNSAAALPTAVVKGNAPKNIGLPAIKGEAVEGRTLEASEGEWEGTPTITYSFLWKSCRAAECKEATGATYVLTKADVGDTVTVRVTASNLAGEESATSNPTAPVEAIGHAAIAWGENYYGGVGQFYKSEQEDAPLGIEGLEEISTASDGGSVTLALQSNGKLMSWGVNQHGELGDNGYKANWELGKNHVEVQLTGTTAISASNEHAMAIAGPEAKVYAWGSNQYAEQGDGLGGVGDAHVPTLVEVEGSEGHRESLKGVKAIAASGSGSDYAVMDNGTVRAWGENKWGELSAEGWPTKCKGAKECEEAHGAEAQQYLCDTETGEELCLKTPKFVVNEKSEKLTGVKEVVAGRETAYALLEGSGHEGEVVSWGGNGSGQLGQPKVKARIGSRFHPPAPVMIEEGGKEVVLKGVKQLSTYWDHVLAVKENGEVIGWGDNGRGELGETTHTEGCGEGEEALCSKIARPIKGLPIGTSGHVEAEAVAAGTEYSLALIGHKVYAWGKNANGELAIGTWKTSEHCITKHEEEKFEQKEREDEENKKLTEEEKKAKIKALEKEEEKKGACSRVPLPVKNRGTETEAGETEAGSTLEHVSAIAAGKNHALALLEPGVKAPAPLVQAKSVDTMGKLGISLEWTPKVSRVQYRLFDYPGEDGAEEGGEEHEEGGCGGEGEPECEESKEGDIGGEGPPQKVASPKIGFGGHREDAFREGQTLRVNEGIWTGSGPLEYKFQWERCSLTDICEAAAPAKECTESKTAECDTYKVVHADARHTLQVTVTASNEYGGHLNALPQTSPPTSIVKAGTEEERLPQSTSVNVTGQHEVLIDEIEEGKTNVPLEEKVPYEADLILGNGNTFRTVITPTP